MRRVTFSIVLLEAYAFLLALLQSAGGVRTDEAKYLLSIPYPHPPILRSLFAFFASLPGSEFFWRFMIASAMVQGVWLLVDIGYVLSQRRRVALVCSWLFSVAFLTQAGTVMLAPLTGLFGIFCVVLAVRPRPIQQKSAPLVGCVWLLGLFSAYQCILYLPLLVSVLRSAHVSWRRIVLFLGVPLLLLVMYTLINPMIIASLVKVGSQDAAVALSVRLLQVLWICVFAGSGLLTVLGMYGIFTGGRMDLFLTFFVILGYIFVTSQAYYAILLTPMLVAGFMLLLARRRVDGWLFLPAHFILTGVLLFRALPDMHPTPARATMRLLQKNGITGLVLIDGPFGHEWQYESSGPIGRFTQTLSSAVEAEAEAVVCTKKTCEEDIGEEWVRMEGAVVEVWVRRR